MAEKYRAGKQSETVTYPILLRKKFQVILLYFGCFGNYRPKFKIRPNFKKKIKKKKKKFLKTKTNLHSVNQKTSKGKK